MLRINVNENILAVYRRHWIILFRDIFTIISIGLFVLLIRAVLKKFMPSMFTSPWHQIFFWITILFYHSLWIAAFARFADYWLDAWILTNERIIDIEQKGLFSREISEFKLDKIQDISVDVSGVIQTLFHYGNVQIETAGFERKFVFKTVPNPQKIKSKILKIHDQYVELKKSQ